MSSSKYPLTREEQKELLRFAENDNIYSTYYVMLAFMLATGCRIGEVIGLTWKDIDFENQYVDINHQVIYKKIDGKTRHYRELPKNRTSRKIPLQGDIINILQKHKEKTYFLSKMSPCTVEDLSNFVFLNNQLKLYTPNTIVRAFHGIRDSYNKQNGDMVMPDFSPHTLRHTFCTRMAENGLDVKVLQEIMGHKTIAVTMQVYNHANFERTKTAVQKLPSALDA